VEKLNARMPYRDYDGDNFVVRISERGRRSVACATVVWLGAIADTCAAVISGGIPLLACTYGVFAMYYSLWSDGQWSAFRRSIRRSMSPFWAFRRLVKRLLLAVLILPVSVYLHHDWEATWVD
jgi:hypothetical protein